MDWLKKHWVYVIVGAFCLLLLFTFTSMYNSATRLIGFVPEDIRNEPPPRRPEGTTPPLRYRPTRTEISGDSLARMDRLRNLLRKQSSELEQVTNERNALREDYAAALQIIEESVAADSASAPPPAKPESDPKQPSVAQLQAELTRDREEMSRLRQELDSTDFEANLVLDQLEALQSVASEAVFRAGEAAVPSLVESLRDDRPNMRLWAATLLGQIGAEARDALPALTEALAEKDEVVRAAIKRAISRIEGG